MDEGSSASFPKVPSSFPGFEPSVQQSAGLSRVEQTLHHHIDACFERLTKLITDKSDRVADVLHRRCDDLEDQIESLSRPAELEAIKSGVELIKTSVDDMRHEVKKSFTGALVAATDSVDLVHALEARVKAVEVGAQVRGTAQGSDQGGTSKRASQVKHASTTGRRGQRHQRINTTGTVEGMAPGKDSDAPGLMDKTSEQQSPLEKAKKRNEPGSTIPQVVEFGTGVFYEPMTMPASNDDDEVTHEAPQSRHVDGLGVHPAFRVVEREAEPTGQDQSADMPGATFPHVVGFDAGILYELPSFASSGAEINRSLAASPPGRT